jgi:hypothetical protein
MEVETSYSETRKRKIPCRRELLIVSLQRFYNSHNDLSTLIPILKGEGELSLRVIDWFVTNYAKKHHISYSVEKQEFIVYSQYKSQLKAFSKKMFDPFCRRERIQFQCGTHEPFITTVGQLNFFRWAFEKKILDYMKEHLEDIQREEKLARGNGTQSSTGSTGSTASNASNVSNATTLSVVSADTIVSVSSATLSTSSTESKTRRRRTEKVQSSTKLMHKHDFSTEITFD